MPGRCGAASRPTSGCATSWLRSRQPSRARLIGPLGAASGVGHIRLSDVPEGTRADYDYDVAISGKVASIGGRMLQGAARAVIALFFRNLIAVAGGRDRRSWWRSLLGRVTPRHTR